jgi:thioredoxin reductase (NADPH)
MENIIIIGSGPAGLTAAIYAARANLSPIIIDGMQPGGQLTQTTDVENYPGFENPISGFELVSAMRKQAERFGVRFMMDAVASCELAGMPKKVTLMMNGTLEARSIIIATGASARYLGLPAEEKLLGRGVSACATCDGSFFKGQRVAVVGGGDTAMVDRVLSTPTIEILWNSVVEEILDVSKGEVTGIKVKNVKSGAITEHALQGFFVAIGHTPNTSIFAGQLEIDSDGYIVAEQTRTSLPGVFAAGDVQDRHFKQAVTSAGTGCIAALQAERYLGTL